MKSTVTRNHSLIADDIPAWSLEKAKGWQYKQLLHGRAKPLGPFESLTLRVSGFRDSLKGYPRKEADGKWSSLRIKKEIDSYEEFCSKSWGRLQIDMERLHQEIERLIRDIKRLENEADDLQAEAPKDNNADLNVRKLGEEKLSDDQILSRRKRERDSKNAPYFARKRQNQEHLAEAYRNLNIITGCVVEAGNAMHLICERAMNRTRQRIDVYWNAALRHKKSAESIPMHIDVVLNSNSEKTYYAQHQHILESAESLLNTKNAEAEKHDTVTDINENALIKKEVA